MVFPFRIVFCLLSLNIGLRCLAETVLPQCEFHRVGARHGHFFDEDSTGSIQVRLPEGATFQPEPLHMQHLSLRDDDLSTTISIYDPAAAFDHTVPLAACEPGIHYLVVRLPQSRRIAWTYFLKMPFAQADSQQTTQGLSGDLRDLALRKLDLFYDEDTTGTWLAMDPDADFHWMREDLYYAVALLDRGGDQSIARANGLIQSFCEAQDRSPGSATLGAFFTNASDLRFPDASTTHFGSPLLAWMLLNLPAGLLPDTRLQMETALSLACDYFIANLLYSPQYQNFYLLGTATLVLGAEVLNRPDLMVAAKQKMSEAYEFLIQNGGPPENNSPVYTGVSQWALKMLIENADETEVVAQARMLSRRLWLDTSLYFHPAALQSAGPYLRVYEDGLRGGAGLTGFMLAQELEKPQMISEGRIAEMVAANHSLDIHPAWFEFQFESTMPAELRGVMLQDRLPSFVRQKCFYSDSACFLGNSFTFGTHSQTRDVLRNEGFVIQHFDSEAPSGISAMFARSGSTTTDTLGYHSGRELFQYSLQDQARAIYLVDRTLPQNEPPGNSAYFALISDERFSQWDELRVNTQTTQPPFAFQAGDILFARRGQTYAAIHPAYSIPTAGRDRFGVVSRGDGHLSICLFTEDAAVPVSKAGSRIEAAFAMAVDEASNWSSFDHFISHYMANGVLAIEETGSSRTIEWSYNGELSLTFDRQNSGFISRWINGTSYSSRFVESDFATQTSDATLQLRDFSASNMPPFSWCIYPPGADSVVLYNPGSTPANISCNWSNSAIPVEPYSSIRIRAPGSSGIPQWSLY